jgi:hypothetical protein
MSNPTMAKSKKPTLLPPPSLRSDGTPHFTPDTIMQAARAYRQAGLSLIPIAGNGKKEPAFDLLPNGAWGGFRKRYPTAAEITTWFTPESVWYWVGLAILGGSISGGLEVIDFDVYELYVKWQSQILREDPALLKKIVWVRSPRPGVHGYFRSSDCGGSQKLARRNIGGDPETGKDEVETLIEVKAEGGYVVAPPSPGECHRSGKPYLYMTGRDLTMVQTISSDERQLILETARSFNEYIDPPRRQSPRAQRQSLSQSYGRKPGDIFNDTADWAEILEPHGWSYTGEGSNGLQYWTRPGKGRGVGGTTNFEGNDLFHVFSSNGDPFDMDKSYSKFAAYTLLNHGGNFQRAAQELRAKGFEEGAAPLARMPSLAQQYASVELFQPE